MFDDIVELTIKDPLAMAMGVFLQTSEVKAAREYKSWKLGLSSTGKSDADATMIVLDDIWNEIYFPYLAHGDGEVVMDQLSAYDPQIKEELLDLVGQIDMLQVRS